MTYCTLSSENYKRMKKKKRRKLKNYREKLLRDRGGGVGWEGRGGDCYNIALRTTRRGVFGARGRI